MSKEILFDKYGNEIVKLEVKYNDKLQSICMNCFRIGGVKWNDIDNGSFLTLTINKKDLIDQLVENEVKFDFDEDDNCETVKQVIVDNEKYIDIEYFARTKADLEAKLAESEKEIKVIDEDRQFKAEMWTRFANKCKDLKQQLAEKEERIDYSFKINTWLIKKYGKEFWQDIGIDEDDNTITNLIKLDEVFDKIYEEMNKEMPKKWYEYGFGSKK